EAVPGYDVVTTIDINMQDIVENELNSMLSHVQADWGVAVLMDVATGDIKAISNLECTKDGNDYIEAMNRAVLGYEPGSVVKTLS
ncbi:penicillin-binding protein, partial [Xanthomonas citri pv. citri]|nr:penicillin-binding protein [Xanthomonas citri pv. citri]